MGFSYIIYSSRPVRTLKSEELEELLFTSRRENKYHGITGMLLCFDDMYIQLIEGPTEAVVQLFQNITEDGRHSRINTLQQGKISDRFFSDWTMGFDKNSGSFQESRESFHITDPQSIRLLEILGWEMN